MTNGNPDHDRIIQLEGRVAALERWGRAIVAITLVLLPLIGAVVIKAFTG